MAISNSIFNPAQQSTGTVMSHNTGILGATINSGGTGSNSAMYQSEMTVDHNKQTNIRITHVENGFIVEVGSEARLIRKYVAKDMDEVRDLITSDMVTQRMEGK
jgi:hypothetical protein